jgi:hypothetical protein
MGRVRKIRQVPQVRRIRQVLRVRRARNLLDRIIEIMGAIQMTTGMKMMGMTVETMAMMTMIPTTQVSPILAIFFNENSEHGSFKEAGMRTRLGSLAPQLLSSLKSR